MSTKSDRRTGLDPTKIVVLTWIHPWLGALWAVLRVGGGTRQKVFVLSLCGNLLFVFVLAIGYYYESEDRQVQKDALLPFGFSLRTDTPLIFCESLPESELTSVLPNAIYVAYDSLLRVRFEFSDESMAALKEVTLTDKYGRPWIDANLEDGTFIFSRYSAREQTDPVASLLDKDSDGIPDTMVDWIRGQRFERCKEFTWCPTTNDDE